MSKIINQVKELMSKAPIGQPMSRSGLSKKLGVSEKSIDRAMKALSQDNQGELIVVFSPSILRARTAVCPESDKCPESDNSSVAYVPPGDTLVAPADITLPPGHRVVHHKYQGLVVVNPQGQIDVVFTSMLNKPKDNAEEDEGSDPWREN